MPKRDRAAYMREYRQRKALERERMRLAALQVDGDAPGGASGSLDPFLGHKIADWAAEKLKVPMGPLRGQPFVMPGWQRRFALDAFAPGVTEAGLSVARKNGKSGWLAAAFLYFLEGPGNFPEWRGIVTSMTGALAGELREAVRLTAEISGIAIRSYRSPTPGRIVGRRGARLDFLAADKSTGHAFGADIAALDEAGLLQENARPLWNAVGSSVSGRNGRLIAISIRGNGPMFGELAERAETSSTVIFHEYAADPAAAVDDPAAWKAANPGLGTIKGMDYMRARAAAVLSTPADEPLFRAYDLNQPQDPTREMIIAVSDWLQCCGEQPPRDGPCVVGIDLGGSSSMTAAVALWANGRLECMGAFPSKPDLEARGKADGVGTRYLTMQRRGELLTMGHRVTPVAEFLGEFAGRLEGVRVTAVGADRYRKEEVIDVLEAAGLAWPIVFRGQGASATADGSHDVRAFQKAVLSKAIFPGDSLLLEHAIAESSVTRDPLGNPRLDKSRARGRIDPLQAAVIATGLRALAPKRKPQRALAII